MAERLSQIVPLGAPAGEAQATAPGAPMLQAQLEEALAQLEHPDADRQELAGRLNHALLTAPKDGGRPLADVLLRALESGRLSELVGPDGRSCRAAAAEALISLGYPYALELSPEDLDHLRQEGSPRTPAPYLLSGLGIVAATAGLEAVSPVPELQPLLWAHVALTSVSALSVALTRPLSRARRWAQGALVLAGVEGAALGWFDAPAALLSGLAAVVAAALMAKTR